jgi:hypothetical protein
MGTPYGQTMIGRSGEKWDNGPSFSVDLPRQVDALEDSVDEADEA